MEEKRIEAAIEYKHSGYNCCHAVLLAYQDVLGLDTKTLEYLGSGFGSGMGCMEGTCGALCGAVIVCGLLKKEMRTTNYTKDILTNFKQLCGATICKDLKGIETGKMLCSCDDCVKNAVISLEQVTPISVKS